MLNEILQWALIAILATLMLGILRQVSLMLPARLRGAPSGPEIGSRVSRRTIEALRRAMPGGELAEENLVAFVTENCMGCQHLLADLEREERAINGTPLLLVAGRPSVHFRKALAGLNVPSIFDEKGQLWSDSDITATPLVIKIDRQGRVLGKEVTHRVDLVASPSPQ